MANRKSASKPAAGGGTSLFPKPQPQAANKNRSANTSNRELLQLFYPPSIALTRRYCESAIKASNIIEPAI